MAGTRRITDTQLVLLKRRAAGLSFRQAAKGTGLSPRKAHDEFMRGLRKAVKTIEQLKFLEPDL